MLVVFGTCDPPRASARPRADCSFGPTQSSRVTILVLFHRKYKHDPCQKLQLHLESSELSPSLPRRQHARFTVFRLVHVDLTAARGSDLQLMNVASRISIRVFNTDTADSLLDGFLPITLTRMSASSLRSAAVILTFLASVLRCTLWFRTPSLVTS